MQEPAASHQFAIVGWLERRRRWQVVLAGVFVGMYAAWRVVRFVARQILDRWWYDTVTDAPVWSTIVSAKLQLILGAGLVTLVVLGGSMYLALTVRSVDGTLPGGLARRYRNRMGPAHRWVLIGVVVVLTVRIGSAAAGEWQNWVLFRHGARVGARVPELGRDLGYYLFDLPFLTTVSAWLRALFLVTFVLTLLGYSITGAVRVPASGHRSRRRALGHLCLLGIAFAVVELLDYVFVRRPALAVSQGGAFVGPGYTELSVTSPVIYALAVVAFLFITAVIVGVIRRGWRWPAAALVVWAALHVLLLVVLPGFVERTLVGSAEGGRQLPYLAHNLAATRSAYRLDVVEVGPLQLTLDSVTAPTSVSDDDLGQIPVFASEQLPSALQVLTGTTGTRISDVDLDRYETADGRQPVFVATRDASRADLPESGWTQRHLVYTHGNGMVMLPAAQTQPDGRPDTEQLRDLLPTRAQLYFGEGLSDWYAVVGTRRTEQGGAAFDADTGVSMSSLWRRVVLALSTGDYQPVLSNELTADSQLLLRRSITERLGALAPFLTLDSDPYPVVSDGRVVWIVDGYTVSSTYPYSQFSTLAGRVVNYVHASVKITMDAYDGTVHLYRTEAGEDDPILSAWTDLLPDLVEPIDDMPSDLRDHLLYPHDLLSIQTNLLGRYHVSDPELLYNGTERWSPAAAAIPGVGLPSPGRAPPVTSMLPDGPAGEPGRFVAQIPYSPGSAPGSASSRDLLSAMVVADHDDPERLRLLRVESDAPIPTPRVAQAAIDADPQLAADFTLRNANGSTVAFGPMTPAVVGDRLLWIRSVIVNSTSGAVIPRVYGLTAVDAGTVGFGPTAADAVAEIARSG